MGQSANGWNFEQYDISHEKGGDQRGICFIEGIIVRTKTEDYPNGGATGKEPRGSMRSNIPFGTKFVNGGAGLNVLNGLLNELDSAIEFCLGVLSIFANFPHEYLDNGVALVVQFGDEGLDGGDALREGHLGPGARSSLPCGE